MPTAADFDRELRELVLAAIPSGRVEASGRQQRDLGPSQMVLKTLPAT
jgi:hypothetical protein